MLIFFFINCSDPSFNLYLYNFFLRLGKTLSNLGFNWFILNIVINLPDVLMNFFFFLCFRCNIYMEEPLDWIAEAESVIESERSLLNHIGLSSSLTVSDGVYLNVETLEHQRFCVLLNSRGFRIVANAFDQDSDFSQICYETHFALFSNISKRYSQCFNELVFAKLNKVSGSCECKDTAE